MTAEAQSMPFSAGRHRAALLSSLDSQREHVLGILEGLSEEELRRPVLPSGWTCLGLVQHLARDVEEFWFRLIVAGEPADDDDDEATAWQVRPEVTAATVFADYRRQIERANAVIAGTSLEAPPAWWPDFFADTFRLGDLHAVIMHVITEIATHAGHLDAARELIDGRTWLILTG